MKLEAWESPEEKARWKIVDARTNSDVPGEIITADDATGECTMRVNGEIESRQFPDGIKIVPRKWTIF